MNSAKYVAGKALRMLSLLIALCIVSFILVKNSPIDPVQAYIGADMMRVSEEQREQIAENWGLDKPPVEQFLSWAEAIVQGDFGTSMIYRAPVLTVIGNRFTASLALMGVAWLLSGIFGFLMGIIAGMNKGKLIDRAIKWYCLTLAATPTFWLGLILLMIFSVWLGWFPIGLGVPVGVLSENVTLSEKIYHLILPALTLSIVGVANIALHTRQKLLDVLESDYILFARANGESGLGLVWKHGVRNIMLPAVTLQFASFSELFGGSVLAEQVFSYPGLGQATVQAGLRGDVPLLLGIVLISAIFVFTGNLIGDIICSVVDPRIKEGRASV
ncbi:MAG: ABC transporter permease [Acetobacterium sp. MES1]|uniref:ABC transporter permease n=1 Tax=Acetobacterium sp. MES1 TaxID=1899015 RepID=UPI000B9CA4E3|nr:ABC transporter permease [Acetobacterium sp. MES1]OXS25065.1 MAG: ABC transporter permease [Acetobacterium sp. MES1]